MYYLTRIVRPCPSTLCILRAHTNQTAIIWLSHYISNSKAQQHDTQTPKTDFTLSHSGTQTATPSQYKPTNAEQCSLKDSITDERLMMLPSSDFDESSNGLSLPEEQTGTSTMLTEVPSPLNGRTLIEKLISVSSPASKAAFTPTHKKVFGCPNTVEKLHLARNVPDLPGTPTFASDYDISHMDLHESLTPEEEYFVSNYELSRLETIMNDMRAYLVSQKAKRMYPTLESLSEEYISISCYTIELTACYYYKRFFLIGSVHDYDTFYILLACVLLAMKVSGMPRKLECMRPMFFAKLFASSVNEKVDVFEKVLRETEEWVYMRLGHDLCTTSLVDLFISEGSRLFMAIADNDDQVLHTSDDCFLKQNLEPLGLYTTITEEITTPINKLMAIEAPKTQQQPAFSESRSISQRSFHGTFDSTHESRRKLTSAPTLLDADLRISSLHTRPSAEDAANLKERSCRKPVTSSPFFEGPTRTEPSSSSVVALPSRDSSNSRNPSPQNITATHSNHISVSSALCSPTKLIHPREQLHPCLRNRAYTLSATFKSSVVTSSGTFRFNDPDQMSSSLSSASERSFKSLTFARPDLVLGTFNGTASDTNMHVSDLNVSNCTDSPSQFISQDIIFTWPRFSASKRLYFSISERRPSIRRAKSTGTGIPGRFRAGVQRRRHIRAHSLYICAPASSVLSLHLSMLNLTPEQMDVSPLATQLKEKSKPSMKVSTYVKFQPLTTLASTNFHEHSSSTISTRSLRNMMNKDTITIAASRSRPLMEDMFAPHNLHMIACSPKQMTPLEQPAKNIRDEDRHTDSCEHTVSGDCLSTTLFKTPNIQVSKAGRKTHRKKNKAVHFVNDTTDSPLSPPKAIPDYSALSPQAIQYVATGPLKQKWAPSRSTSLTLHDSKDSKKTVKQERDQPVLAAIVTPHSTLGATEILDTCQDIDFYSQGLIYNMKDMLNCNEHTTTEELLLEVPPPHMRILNHPSGASYDVCSTTDKTSPIQNHLSGDVTSGFLRISSVLISTKLRSSVRLKQKLWLKQLNRSSEKRNRGRRNIKTIAHGFKRISMNSPCNSSIIRILTTITRLDPHCLNLPHFILPQFDSFFSHSGIKIPHTFSASFILSLDNNNISPILSFRSLSHYHRNCFKSGKAQRINSIGSNGSLQSRSIYIDAFQGSPTGTDAISNVTPPTLITPATIQVVSVPRIIDISVGRSLLRQFNSSKTSSHNKPAPPTEYKTTQKHVSSVAEHSCISEHTYKMSLNIGPNVSLSFGVPPHSSSATSCMSFRSDLPDIFYRSNNQLSHQDMENSVVYNSNDQPYSSFPPNMLSQASIRNTITIHNISTMSTVHCELPFSDDHYIKRITFSKAKVKLRELVSMKFNLIIKYILSTPPILEYISETCQLPTFSKLYKLAFSTIKDQMRSMAHFGSSYERECAKQLTDDNISMLSFLFTTSYAYSSCFKCTDMLLLFPNASISVFLLAESILLLNNRILPYLATYTGNLCKEESNEVLSVNPSNLPLHHPTNDSLLSAKSISTYSTGKRASLLSAPLNTTQSSSIPTTSQSVSTDAELKPLPEQDDHMHLSKKVHKILSSRIKSPIYRSTLYSSFIGYKCYKNVEVPASSTFGFRMGAQQHSMITMEEVPSKAGRASIQSSHGSFDSTKGSATMGKDASDELYSILKTVLFVTETYPRNKNLRAHQEHLASDISKLKEKYFAPIYETLRASQSSHPISIYDYMAGVRNIFNLVQTKIFPRLRFCQYMIKQPGTTLHDIRKWQKRLKLDLDRKTYRRLRGLAQDASHEQQVDLRRQMTEISTKWNVTGSSFWEDSDIY